MPLESLPPDPALWAQTLLNLGDDARYALGAELVAEWVQGRLEPRFLGNQGAPAAVTALRKQLFAALEATGDPEAFYTVWSGSRVDESMARRWCWIPSWWLCSDDEDLLLMDDALVEPLLEEAKAGCPKQAYARDIAEHHVRDQAFASLRSGADAVKAKLTQLQRFKAAAQANGATELEAYLARLQGYTRPGKVDQPEAEARMRDLWRCHAPAHVAPTLLRGEWRCAYNTVVGYEQWIVIDAKTGAMWLDSAALKR